MKQFHNREGQLLERICMLESQLEDHKVEMVTLEEQREELKTELQQTSDDLGNTRVKLDGLAGMELKCQELYEEIKKEQGRWESAKDKAAEEKKALQKELNFLREKEQELEAECNELEEDKEKVEG